MPTSKNLLALILSFSLIAPPRMMLAQQTTTQPQPTNQPQPASQPLPANQPQSLGPVMESLKIIVLEGEGAINSIEKQTAKAPVVEVRNENDQPVEGAEVVFRAPPSGPGGSFNQKASKVGKTNVQGQVAGTGFSPNSESGRFQIHVTATFGNKVGQADISQVNALHPVADIIEPKRRFGWKKILIISGIAAGATIGIVLATRGSSDPTITITPGPVTIGGR